MGTILASSIITDMSVTLNDLAFTDYTTAQLLSAINAGQVASVLLKPDIYYINENMILVGGSKQSIPTGASKRGWKLIDIIRNMGPAGTTPGRAIRVIGRKTLDEQDPDWPSATAAAVVERYFFDKRFPKNFYTYPPQPSSGFGYVEIVYSAFPPEIAVSTDPITLDDIYRGVLYEYGLYRMFSKDTGNLAFQQRKENHKSEWLRLLGMSDVKEDIETPNVQPAATE